MNPTIAIAIAALVAVVALTVLTVATRYKIAGPNEAFLITGRRGKGSGDLSGQRVIIGGGAFVIPFVHNLTRIDLSSRKIKMRVDGAIAKNGIKVNVEAMAVVKVGGDDHSIRAAAERFATSQATIEDKTTEALNGALRSIIGTLTVEEIISDRTAFAAQVIEVTETALTNQGLALDTFQIQDVTDDGDYLRNMGRPEAARVEQQAKIAEANARRTAEQQRLAAEQDILDANRAYDLRQAQITADTASAKANAEAAGPLAEAAKRQEILTAQELVAEKQAALTDRELDTKVRKPADAARYQAEQEAEASRITAVAEARAAAESAKLTGEAERDRRAAIAEATRLEGEAQAAATLATGSAEAEAMQKKADAYKQYGEAAVVQMLVEQLPNIAHELAAPMSNIDKLTVISTDGASALPKSVAGNMTQLQQLVKDTLGLDMSQMIAGFAGGKAAAATTTTPALIASDARVDA